LGPAKTGVGAVVEVDHFLSDVRQTVLNGEMAGVEAVHLGFREIFEEGFSALRGEEYVVLRPENDCSGLVAAQAFLPFRVQLDIGAVVIEEVELRALCVWPREEI
jgi:hypothetical protein